MNNKSMKRNPSFIYLGRARLAVLRLLLLSLLPAGLLILSALAAPSSTPAPPAAAGLLADTPETQVGLVEASPKRSLGNLLDVLANFLLVFGAVVIFIELWARRGERGTLFVALGGVFVLAIALAGRAVVATVGRLWFVFLVTTFLVLSVAAASAGSPDSAGLGQPVGSAGLGIVLLAQAAADPPFEPIIAFLSKVMMLVGGIMVFAGGWKIHRGENSEGLQAITGGFIVATAFATIRYFFTHS